MIGPCDRLMTFITPQISDRPIAAIPYTNPSNNPSTREGSSISAMRDSSRGRAVPPRAPAEQGVRRGRHDLVDEWAEIGRPGVVALKEPDFQTLRLGVVLGRRHHVGRQLF